MAKKMVLYADRGTEGIDRYTYNGSKDGLINVLWLCMFGGQAEERHIEEVEGVADALIEKNKYHFEDGHLYLGCR